MVVRGRGVDARDWLHDLALGSVELAWVKGPGHRRRVGAVPLLVRLDVGVDRGLGGRGGRVDRETFAVIAVAMAEEARWDAYWQESGEGGVGEGGAEEADEHRALHAGL